MHDVTLREDLWKEHHRAVSILIDDDVFVSVFVKKDPEEKLFDDPMTSWQAFGATLPGFAQAASMALVDAVRVASEIREADDFNELIIWTGMDEYGVHE